MKRVTVSLPDDLVGNIDRVARLMGVSRSGLLSGLLKETDFQSLEHLLSLAVEARESSDPEVVRRFRGDSALVITDQLQRVLESQGGLFNGS